MEKMCCFFFFWKVHTFLQDEGKPPAAALKMTSVQHQKKNAPNTWKCVTQESPRGAQTFFFSPQQTVNSTAGLLLCNLYIEGFASFFFRGSRHISFFFLFNCQHEGIEHWNFFAPPNVSQKYEIAGNVTFLSDIHDSFVQIRMPSMFSSKHQLAWQFPFWHFCLDTWPLAAE